MLHGARPVVLGLVALAVLAAGAALAGDDVPGRSAALRRRHESIAAVEARLAVLVERANEDRRTPRVEQYLALATSQDFARSGRPRAAELVEILADDAATPAVRERVREALKSVTHLQADPDLQYAGRRSKRAAFSRERLLPLLLRPGARAQQAREIAADVLTAFWMAADPAVVAYDATATATWKPAHDAYRRLLDTK